MRALSTHASLWLLGLSVYMGGWYMDGSAFQMVQLGSVSLFIASGFLALLSGNTRRAAITSTEYIVGGAFAFAMLVAFLRDNPLSTAFGGMFLLVLVSAAVLVRQADEGSYGVVFRRVYLALLITILLVQPGDYFTSVAGTTERAVGLVRLEPLGLHPNLSGLVYGGGALLFFQQFLVTEGFGKRVLLLGTSAMCLSLVLAASARASMLALGLTGAVAVGLLAWKGSNKARKTIGAAALLMTGVAILSADKIASYLTVILDLNSPTRGVDSGATGRADIWRDGVALVFSDPVLLFTGRGIRAAGPDVIGFPVESSYINLALENGAVFGVLITVAFVVTAARALINSVRNERLNTELLLSGLMLVFVLAQSIFNRYLIAVGNPYSLLVLMMLLRLNLKTAPSEPQPHSMVAPPSLSPLRQTQD